MDKGKKPRHGWAASFKKMHEHCDDILLIPDELDSDLSDDDLSTK